MANKFSDVMDFVHALNKTHGVKQRGGKMYTQVVLRMEAFRRFYGTEYGVDTQILVDDGQRVVVKATITNLDGIVVGSGMAEEIRGQGYFELGDKRNINTTSAIENCETSAIGRALAMMGIGIDTSIASANEVNDAIAKQESTPTKKATKTKKSADEPDLMSKAIGYIKTATDKRKAYDSVVAKYGEQLTEKQLEGIQKFVR